MVSFTYGRSLEVNKYHRLNGAFVSLKPKMAMYLLEISGLCAQSRIAYESNLNTGKTEKQNMTDLIENTESVILYRMQTVYDRARAAFNELEDMVANMKHEWGNLNEKAYAELMDSRDFTPAAVERRNDAKRKQAGRRISFLKRRLQVEIAMPALLTLVNESLTQYTLRTYEIISKGELKDPRQIQVTKINALIAVKLTYMVRALCKETEIFIERSCAINPELRETLDKEFERIYRDDTPDDTIWRYLCSK